GFFIFDFTLPEFKDGKIVPGTGGVEKDEFYISATLGIKLGIALGPLKGGGFGSINFYAGLDLQDIARSELTKDDRGYVTDVKWVSDGRIRGSEIATMFAYEGGGFLNLFNARMGATLSLGVFVELDLGLFTITFFKATLFKFNLFQLQYNAPRVQPYLATQVGDTLYLNSGDRAGLRKYFDVTDGDEEFILYGEGGEVSIEFDNWYQTYRGVNKVVANMGAGNDTLDASRLNGVTVDFRGGAGDDEILLGGGRMVNGTREGGSVRGGTGNDTITVAPGMLARYRLDGEEGDDKITGGLGDDTLVGGDGENRLTGTAGNNRYIIGAAKTAPVGSQQIRGGAGYETYEFLDNIGEVSFNDRQNGVALDFDALSDGIVVNVNKRVVSVTNELGQELRISGSTVDDIRLTRWTDTVYVTDFPAWAIEVEDTGGADDYRITMGRGSASGGTGTINIKETGTDFDELILEQTRSRSADAISLDLNTVTNGREVVTYQNGLIDRLTLKGKGASYTENEIISLGGDVRFTTLAGTGGVSNLGKTGFRAIGREIHQESSLMATGIVLEAMRTINVKYDYVTLQNSHFDIRTYGDRADVKLNANLFVSNDLTANSLGTGDSAWVRIQVADGSLLNENGSYIAGAGAYVQIKAKNAIGTNAKPILTRVATLTIATSTHGSGDVVIREDDNLVLIEERALTSPENPGYVIFADQSHPSWNTRWESTVEWDNNVAAGASVWRDLIRKNRAVIRPDIAVEVGRGNLRIELELTDALLTLQSGYLQMLKTGANIHLITDDLNFVSGVNRVVGTGELRIQAKRNAWHYVIGTAAETQGGLDYEEDSDQQVNNPAMNVSNRDLAALADGFDHLIIGHIDTDGSITGTNTMRVGDVTDTNLVRY
ncbi:MAG: calcium-binding protein, partial [Bacteroidetes bacterium]|nr:calcium-binding protein [Bacteroidota bacterium]